MHAPQPPVLLVAALQAEVWPVWLRMDRRVRLDARLWSGRLAGAEVALLRCGVGREAARRRTARALGLLEPRAVVSFGTCGALVDELSVGEVVGAVSLWGEPPIRLQPIGRGVRQVTLATVPRVVADARARALWAARGAQVCEMEAAGVLEAAGTRPFHALKVISDRAGARRPDGYRRPRALSLAHFQLRAVRLVHRQLAPVLEAWLGDAD
jgi:nucleoside phosphorylase